MQVRVDRHTESRKSIAEEKDVDALRCGECFQNAAGGPINVGDRRHEAHPARLPEVAAECFTRVFKKLPMVRLDPLPAAGSDEISLDG